MSLDPKRCRGNEGVGFSVDVSEVVQAPLNQQDSQVTRPWVDTRTESSVAPHMEQARNEDISTLPEGGQETSSEGPGWSLRATVKGYSG